MTTNRFLEFFLKLLSRYSRLSKQSFVRFLYAPLTKKLVKLDSAVVSMVFQELCHLLAILLDCSSSPCRSLLISKPTLCKTILSSSFVLETCTKTDKLFFLLWRHSLTNSVKNSEYYTCRSRFLSNCVIILVQQRHTYQV